MGKHNTQMQNGYDFSNTSLDDIATKLGTQGYTPSYDSNTQGSYESNYNTILNKLTPDQLIKRYQSGSNPMYQTGIDQANALAYNSFKSIVGRDPTGAELAQVLPIFQGPNGQVAGNAYLSSFAQQLKQNPANNVDKAPQYTDAINKTFQSTLGRAATPDEISHFGSNMATGNVDAYQLQDFIKGTPEYQAAQDNTFRQGLSNDLQNTDLSFFSRAKQDVMSQFAQNGTSRSTALDSALTDLMGQVKNQRDQYMAGLTSQQYSGNKDLALNNYANTQNQFLNNQSYNRQQSQNQMDYLTGRSNNLADYQTQKNDYQNFYNSNQPNPLMNYVNTGLNVARTGASIYGAFGGGGGGSAPYGNLH